MRYRQPLGRGREREHSLHPLPYQRLIHFRHGATVEEMTIEVNKAKANLQAVEKDLRSMTALNHARHKFSLLGLHF